VTDPANPGHPLFDATPDLGPDGLYAWESYLANIQSAYDPTSPEPPTPSPADWNRLTYTGHEFDPETGLYYFKARFYDPELGRFASADPYLGDSLTPPSLHRYLYAYASPLTFVDQTGYLAYRYFGREADSGQERPYVVAEIETEDVYRHPIHSILSGYRFEDYAQQNAFLNELGRLNPGIVSVDSQGRAGWNLEVLGRAGQAVRLPVSAEYRLTDAATAEIVAESGGATNMDEWRRHQLARQVPQAVRQRVQTTVNMARKTAERLAGWSQDSAETLAFGPYTMGAESVAVAEWAGRMTTESGRQEFSEAVYGKLEYLLRTEAGAEDVSATLLSLFILGRISPPSAEHTWLKLESPASLETVSRVIPKSASIAAYDAEFAARQMGAFQGYDTKVLLGDVMFRARGMLQENPELMRSLMSEGSYRHILRDTKLAEASFGKAIERLTARIIKEDPQLSRVFIYTGRYRGPNGRYISSPDFIGLEPSRTRLFDITTEKALKTHQGRAIAPWTDYLFYR